MDDTGGEHDEQETAATAQPLEPLGPVHADQGDQDAGGERVDAEVGAPLQPDVAEAVGGAPDPQRQGADEDRGQDHGEHPG